MRNVIEEKLCEIEARENVRILHCVESGSRAWGFPSPDSDYDVRFVYVRPRDYYLRLERTRDVIEWQLDDTLDINGWDLQKLLRLLHKVNPAVFEWNASKTVYRTTDEWGRISPVIDRYFVPRAGVYHYLSMAKRNCREYLSGDTVKLKKYFYILRPLLACRWIIAEGTPPPMLFGTLCDRCLEESVKPHVAELLYKKMSMTEMGEAAPIAALGEYIERSCAEIEAKMPQLAGAREEGFDELNALFLSFLG